MGYAHAILGNTAEAVDCFHKALGLRTDDTFSTTMLTYVIEELADKSQPFKGKRVAEIVALKILVGKYRSTCEIDMKSSPNDDKVAADLVTSRHFESFKEMLRTYKDKVAKQGVKLLISGVQVALISC